MSRHERRKLANISPRPYLFFRADGWYPLELKNDDEAKANALNNPGTQRVEDALTGETVWRMQ